MCLAVLQCVAPALQNVAAAAAALSCPSPPAASCVVREQALAARRPGVRAPRVCPNSGAATPI